MKLKNKNGDFTGVNRFDLYLMEGEDQEVIDYLETLPVRRRNDALRRLLKACLSGEQFNQVTIPKVATAKPDTRQVEIQQQVLPDDINWSDDFESFGFPTTGE